MTPMLPDGSGCNNKHLTVGSDQTVCTSSGSPGSACTYVGAILNPGTASSTLTIYDGPSANGIILGQLIGAANGGSVADELDGYKIKASTNSIHATLAGTGATAEVRFKTS